MSALLVELKLDKQVRSLTRPLTWPPLRPLTCNHEHDSSDHGRDGFAVGLLFHEVSALHAHCGHHNSQSGEENAEQHHSPGSLDFN